MASSAWEARNARARAAGYRNYYDYRIHDNGRLPPDAPPLPGGSTRARARGHAGEADFLRLIQRTRDAYVLPVGQERQANGQYSRIHLLVLLPPAVPGGPSREAHFWLRGQAASNANLRRLKAELQSAGIFIVAAPSIDVFATVDEPVDVDEAA